MLRKTLTGILLGASLIGAPCFNANAQEDSISRYEKLDKLGFVEALYLRYDPKPNEKYIPKYNTTAHKMLMIEDSGKVCSYPPLRKLDEVINISKKFIKKTHYTKQELSDLSKKIYSTINSVDYYLAHDAEEGALLMMPTLEHCYIYSLYYLAVGEANNLPFYAVNFEQNIEYPLITWKENFIGKERTFVLKEKSLGHIFIRYDPDGKHDVLNPNAQVNKGDINIEATTGEIQTNEEYSDTYYIDKYNLSNNQLKKGISLTNLDEKRLLEIAYIGKSLNNIKYANKIKNRFEDKLDEEIKNCNSQKDPVYGFRLPATKSQREECLKENNIEFRKDSIKVEHAKLINASLKDFNKIIESNPNSFRAYYCKGIGYKLLCSGNWGAELNKEDKNFILNSIENYIKASKLVPTPEIYGEIASNYYSLSKDGCYKDIEYITKAINLINENIKKEKNLERTKDLENKLKELENSKKQIEESSKYHYKWCDKMKNSKQSP